MCDTNARSFDKCCDSFWANDFCVEDGSLLFPLSKKRLNGFRVNISSTGRLSSY